MFSKKKDFSLFAAATLVAIGGLIYELIIGTVSSYLLGNSVLHFSITIGLFLFGMGIGSILSNFLKKEPTSLFICNELLLGMIGGNAVVILFGLFSFAETWFYLGFGSLVVGIGALIGLEIPLLLRMLQGMRHTHQVVTRVLSLDYVGSLIASVVFPLLLLPYLGLLRTSLVIGLINVSLAATVYFFSPRKKVNRSRGVTASLIGCWLILFVEVLASNYVAAYFDQKLYQDEVIYNQQTTYQKIVISRFKDDIRLYLDANLQFSSLDEHRYHESLIHVPISYLASGYPQNALVLGGGDGLAARELLKYDSVESITVVDLDPAMTKLAQSSPLLLELNHDSLSDPKVTIVNQDALNFLTHVSERYDLIVIDLPDPNNEGLAKLYSQEFYHLAIQRLAENGILVTQATSPYFSNRTFWMIAETIKSNEVFTQAYHVNVPSFGEWGFVMASKNAVFTEPRPITAETKFLTNEVGRGLLTFDKDILPQLDQPEISTLHSPIILQAYEEDARRWKPQ
jgi:spermidine synthase